MILVLFWIIFAIVMFGITTFFFLRFADSDIGEAIINGLLTSVIMSFVLFGMGRCIISLNFINSDDLYSKQFDNANWTQTYTYPLVKQANGSFVDENSMYLTYSIQTKDGELSYTKYKEDIYVNYDNSTPRIEHYVSQDFWQQLFFMPKEKDILHTYAKDNELNTA
jgi:hypothetical protein